MRAPYPPLFLQSFRVPVLFGGDKGWRRDKVGNLSTLMWCALP